jgi:transcriptional regulator with XRE-family HTH domain
MQTIGERLEEARKRRGISLREAAEATKIRADYLQNFEGNTFDIGLPEIYVRGFLRNYAEYLKVDSKKVLSDYSVAVNGGDVRSREPAREHFGRLDLGGPSQDTDTDPPVVAPSMPPPMPEAPRIQGNGLMIASIVGGVVVLGILLVFALSSLFGGRDEPPSRTNAPTLQAPTVAQREFTLIGRNGPVTVTVVQMSDGQTIFSGTLQPGERRSVLRSGDVRISVDVGTNLLLERGGQRFQMSDPGRHSTIFPE